MALATTGKLQPALYQTDRFTLQAFQRFTESGRLLTIYLEGDGAAWRNRSSRASDPTPRHPMALALAAQDQGANVLYLARPCQYQGSTACQASLWSSHRYSNQVITTLNQAIDQAKGKAGASQLRLVGYSGGGTLATLLAAQRTDVCQLITVAANLDIELWARHHRVSPLWGSQTPLHYGDALQHLPQYHLVGSDDQVVPATIVRSYIDQLPRQEQVGWRSVAGLTHHGDWPGHWPALLQEATRASRCQQTE